MWVSVESTVHAHCMFQSESGELGRAVQAICLNAASKRVTRGQFHQHIYAKLLRTQIPKAQKNSQVISFFALLGSQGHKMLVKSTPGLLLQACVRVHQSICVRVRSQHYKQFFLSPSLSVFRFSRVSQFPAVSNRPAVCALKVRFSY